MIQISSSSPAAVASTAPELVKPLSSISDTFWLNISIGLDKSRDCRAENVKWRGCTRCNRVEIGRIIAEEGTKSQRIKRSGVVCRIGTVRFDQEFASKAEKLQNGEKTIMS